MKIKLLRGVVILGRAHRIGDVVDAPDWQGKYLIGRGKATHVQETEVTPAPPKKGAMKKEP